MLYDLQVESLPCPEDTDLSVQTKNAKHRRYVCVFSDWIVSECVCVLLERLEQTVSVTFVV